MKHIKKCSSVERLIDTDKASILRVWQKKGLVGNIEYFFMIYLSQLDKEICKMGVRDLSSTELRQLKETYYTEKHDAVSFGELANIDSLVSDEEVFEAYADTYFVKEDFWG